MTNDEKEALLGYFEFTLTAMVEGLETQKIISGSPQIGAVYDATYEVLNEMERLMTERIELQSAEKC